MKTTKYAIALSLSLLGTLAVADTAAPEHHAGRRFHPVADMIEDIDQGVSCLNLAAPKASDVVVARSGSDSSFCSASIRINYSEVHAHLLVGYDNKSATIWQQPISVNVSRTFEYAYPNFFYCEGPSKDFDKETRARAVEETLNQANAFYASNAALVCQGR